MLLFRIGPLGQAILTPRAHLWKLRRTFASFW